MMIDREGKVPYILFHTFCFHLGDQGLVTPTV